jgi:hypothetical protein
MTKTVHWIRFFNSCAPLLLLLSAARAESNAPRPVPIIFGFGAAATDTIKLGDTVILNWAVSDAAQLSISPDIGVVTGTSLHVRPAGTTTYTLVATNAAGSTARTTRITVIAPANAAGDTPNLASRAAALWLNAVAQSGLPIWNFP